MADNSNSSSSNSNRGLASADEQTRKRVASEGGKAYHEKRGAHGSDHDKNSQKGTRSSQSSGSGSSSDR